MLDKILRVGAIIVVAIVLFVGGAWLGVLASNRMNRTVVTRSTAPLAPRFGQGQPIPQPRGGFRVGPGMWGGPDYPAKPGQTFGQQYPNGGDDQGEKGNQDSEKGQGQTSPVIPQPGMINPVPAAPNVIVVPGVSQAPQTGPSFQIQGSAAVAGAGQASPNGPSFQMQSGGVVPAPDLVPAAGATLTLDNAVKVAQAYVAMYSDPNLKVAEVMQFANHFYARVMEKDSGRGAFEILIDPRTAAVYSEPGPNMMWNLKYGMMSGQSGMMSGINTTDGGATMTVDAKQAAAFATKELASLVPGATLEGDGVAFYGYYTFDYAVNGKIVGMLGVNGYTGDVVLHVWHGSFVAEQQVK